MMPQNAWFVCHHYLAKESGNKHQQCMKAFSAAWWNEFCPEKCDMPVMEAHSLLAAFKNGKHHLHSLWLQRFSPPAPCDTEVGVATQTISTAPCSSGQIPSSPGNQRSRDSHTILYSSSKKSSKCPCIHYIFPLWVSSSDIIRFPSKTTGLFARTSFLSSESPFPGRHQRPSLCCL